MRSSIRHAEFLSAHEGYAGRNDSFTDLEEVLDLPSIAVMEVSALLLQRLVALLHRNGGRNETSAREYSQLEAHVRAVLRRVVAG